MTLDLFENAGVVVEGDKWHWYLYGRYMVREVTGWPKEKEITRRRVYHYADSVIAATEDQARKHCEKLHGKTDSKHQCL